MTGNTFTMSAVETIEPASATQDDVETAAENSELKSIAENDSDRHGDHDMAKVLKQSTSVLCAIL